MEILIRSMALAAGVQVASNVTVLPPRRPGPGPAARLLGRALKWLGRTLYRAGAALAPPPRCGLPRPGIQPGH